jgi:hypothetical protein
MASNVVEIRQGSHPHIGWIDIQKNGIFVECAIMKRDRLGNVYYFPIKWLDEIDKLRLYNIITNRNARSFELWDLMSQITLNNGVNSLSYFHQLVRQMTPSGQILTPGIGQTGSSDWDTRVRKAPADQLFSPEMIAEAAAKAAGEAAAAAAIAAYNQVTAPPVQQVVAAAPKTVKKTTKKKS